MPTEPASDAERATEIAAKYARWKKAYAGDESVMEGERVSLPHEDLAWLLSDRAVLVKRVEELEASYRRLATEHAQMEDTIMAIGDVLGDAEFLDRSTAEAKVRIEALTRAITEAAESENALISTGAKLIQQRVAPASPDASDREG